MRQVRVAEDQQDALAAAARRRAPAPRPLRHRLLGQRGSGRAGRPARRRGASFAAGPPAASAPRAAAASRGRGGPELAVSAARPRVRLTVPRSRP